MKRRQSGAPHHAVLIVIALACGAPACRDSDAEIDKKVEKKLAAKQDEIEENAEKKLLKKKLAAKQKLIDSPGSFLESSNFKSYDKGFINSYRQLTAVSVLNKSTFPVANLQGMVDWYNAAGEVVGSTKVTLTGSIPAGDTKSFSTDAGTMASGTLQSGATRLAIRWTSIRVIDAE